MSSLKPLGFLYEKAAGLKNLLYDNQVFTSVKIPIPVVSLGNLTMGGTGKTPLAHFCLQYFREKKLKVAVVSRNYRAEVTGMARVDLTRNDAASYFGDEPVLLAEKNPDVAFYVGPQKFKSAEWAYQDSKPDLILVDDGFQHRQLSRALDLVILDATESFPNYACVPAGRAREPWSSLERADAILISKRNLASAENVRELLERTKPFAKPIVTFDFVIGKWARVCSTQPASSIGGDRSSGEAVGTENPREKILAVSGIARPEVFEQTLREQSADVIAHERFKDHHEYSAADVERILARARSLANPTIVTTEKDAVKLRSLWPNDVPLWVVPLEVRIHSGEKEFYEILAEVVR